MKKQNKKALIYLLVACGIVGTGVSGYYIGKYQSEQNQDKTQEVNVIEERGINIKRLTDNSSGVRDNLTFTYTVTPSCYTGSINARIDWTTPNSELISTYYEIEHVKTSKLVRVFNNAPCDYQAIIKIFSVDNPNISASVTVDYKQKIKGVECSIPDGTKCLGDTGCIQGVINKTKGSIKNTASVSEWRPTKMYLNSSFANWAVEQMKKIYGESTETLFNGDPINQCTRSGGTSIFGLMISNDVAFVTYDFFTNITTEKSTHSDLSVISASELTAYFTEEKDVFDIDVTVDDEVYHAPLKLKMLSYAITSFGVPDTGLIFG